jgi:HlyD family secretion protein
MTEERAQAGRLWRWVGAAVVVAGVFFTARYLLRGRLPIRAVQAEQQTVVNTVSTNGHVEPVVNYQFYSPISTTVKAVYVHAGELVPAGKVLVVLDDVEARAHLANAESELKAAQAGLFAVTHNGTQQERQAAAAEIATDRLQRDQAQRNLNALTRLVSTGAASPDEVAAARQQLKMTQTALSAAEKSAHSRYSPEEVAQARAALNDAEASLAAARQVEAQTTIRAPIQGTVYSLDAVPTQYVQGGTLLLEMANLKHERVRAYFDEPDLGRLAVGQKVIIRWVGKPSQEWEGHIERMPANVVIYGTRTVGEALVAIDSPDPSLLPDTNVTLTATTATFPNALSVPREALYAENGKYYVYKIVDDSLHRTPVTIGTPTLSEVPILSGLKEGDWVATETTNGQPLQVGMPIKVQQ